jgi:hypothetical protein
MHRFAGINENIFRWGSHPSGDVFKKKKSPEVLRGQPPTTTFFDHFLYEAGGGARPPSLSLLPGFYVPVQLGYRKHRDPTPQFRYLGMTNTGILRRGEDDLVVCQYEMTCDPPIYDMGELCMLCIGRDREWIVRRVPIVEHREGCFLPGAGMGLRWHGRRRTCPGRTTATLR